MTLEGPRPVGSEGPHAGENWEFRQQSIHERHVDVAWESYRKTMRKCACWYCGPDGQKEIAQHKKELLESKE